MPNTINDISDIDMPALSEHPLTESVKYHGPPGTGKTTTSLGRVGRIVESDGVEYGIGDIAFVTYRKSLATDVLHTAADVDLIPRDLVEDKQTRLESNVRFWGTLHAVAGRAWEHLNAHQIVSEKHKREFCRDILGVPYTTRNPYRDAVGKIILQTIQWCRKNLIDPTDPTAPVEECPHYDEVQERWGGSIATAARRWGEYKESRGDARDEEAPDPVVDFVDLLEVALERNVVPTTQVLVVDEYHDAYPLFAAVCRQWMQWHDIVIVAGDPHQCINSYRGARPQFFEEVDLPVIDLTKSRRVPVEHYSAALRCLAPVHDLPEVTPNGHGDIVELRADEPMQQDDAGEWEVPGWQPRGSPGDVHDRMQERAGVDDTFMHLCRTRRQAGAVSAALDDAGIAHVTQDGIPGGWDDQRIAVFNVLSAAAQCDLSHCPGAAPAGDVEVDAAAVRVAVKAAPMEYLDPHHEGVQMMRDEFDAEDVPELGLGESMMVSVSDVDSMVTPGFWQACGDADALREWVGAGCGDMALSERDVSAVSGALRRRTMGDRVQPRDLPVVQTVHASKGSEASHVAVYPGATESIEDAMESSEVERKNEHRTWYVALTRASESLYVVHDAVAGMRDVPESGPQLRGVEQAARQVAGGD